MLEAVVFAAVFLGFFALRFVLATLFFYALWPEGDRCPSCNADTLHMQSRFMRRRFRASWCPRCNWEGMLKRAPQPPAKTRSHSGQLPLSSKKSSK